MDRKVRFGIIGSAGLIGNYHSDLLMKGEGPYELTALCDIREGPLTEQMARLALPGTTSPAELVQRDDLDAVIVATPHPQHAEHTILAVEAGKDVLTEKPLAHTPSAARRMIKAMNRCRRIGGIHYQSRARPGVMKVREMIDSGELGKLLAVRMTGSWYKSDYYYSLGGWRGLWRDEGGGTLINQAPHDIDLMCYFGAKDRPAELTGWWTNMYHDTSQADDIAAAAGRFPNGVTFSMHVSVALHGDPPRHEVFGSAGAVSLVDGEINRYIRYQQDLIDFCRSYGGPNPYEGPEVIEQPLPAVGEHDPALLHKRFAEAVLTRKKSRLLVAAAEGLWSMETINAVLLSGHLGRKVKLPVPPGRYDKVLAELIAKARPVERRQRESERGRATF